MGITRKWYGLTLIVVGITTFPITSPTLGAGSVSIATLGCGISMIFF